jgi:UDP-glucose 4-epimerase
MIKNKNVLITGGSGFIGKILHSKLKEYNKVTIIDKIKPQYENNNFIKQDLSKKVPRLKKYDLIMHLAAFSDVRESTKNTKKVYNDNLYTTINILDKMIEDNVQDIVYTSTSAVYGKKKDLPIQEKDSKDPISDYGSSKLAGENIIRVKSNYEDINYTILRFGNIIGKNGHGVIQDFIKKLKKNPNNLKILGNGKQRKSYLYVRDCVNAILYSYKQTDENQILNISSEDTINVNEIADIISEEMGVNPEYTYTGGEQGWSGDVSKFRLSIQNIKNKTDWRPSYDSEESVRKTVREIL